MGDGYDRYTEEAGGAGFVLGLVTGAAIGAGLALLFAPKPGADFRRQLSEQAGTLADTAARTYRRARGAAENLADRGRDLYGQANDVVSRAAGEVRAMADDVQRPIS